MASASYEVHGLPAAEGFALGRAIWLDGGGRLDATRERERVGRAVHLVHDDLERLLASLPAREADLYRPELELLDAIAPSLEARHAAGEPVEESVFAETSHACADLAVDLRERLLGALGGATEGAGQDLVLLTQAVTPALVALLPRQIVAILAAQGGHERRLESGRTSHAAELARSRGLPLVFVDPEVLTPIAAGTRLMLDAAENKARVLIDPDEATVHAARHRLDARDLAARRPSTHPPPPLGVALRVTLSSAHDPIPRWVEGVGVLRTEMMFGAEPCEPGEEEQLAAILRVAAKVPGSPVVVRLFDAGGDKPLAWLGDASDPRRGIARLLGYPQVLARQVRAIGRARERADVRVLLPMVEGLEAVAAVRALAPPGLPVGVMVETTNAVRDLGVLAPAADFVAVGTNDLTASVLGLSRGADMPALDPRVLGWVRRAIEDSRAAGRHVTVCGELPSHERGAVLVAGMGADALSVAPARAAHVRRALASTTLESYRGLAFVT